MSLYLLSFLLLVLVEESAQWSGHYVAYTKIDRYEKIVWCDCRSWWSGNCCGHSSRTEPIYITDYRCAAMWTHNGNQNCNIPLCSATCSDREECVAKPSGAHVCQCKSGFVGADCDCPVGNNGTNCELPVVLG